MIETTDPVTRTSVVKEIDYVVPMNANSNTRGETNKNITTTDINKENIKYLAVLIF